MASTERPKNIPPQHQGGLPGHEEDMDPRTQSFMGAYRPAGKLRGKVAIVTGGDSGIGRAVSIAFAKEGADLAILYLNEYEDAETTKQAVEAEGRRCMLFAGDIANRDFVNRWFRWRLWRQHRMGFSPEMDGCFLPPRN